MRSSERAWLHSRRPSKLFEVERDDQQIVIALGGVEQRFGRIGLDVDGVLGGEDRRQPLIGRLPVVDQQDAAALAGIGDGAALGRLHADLERGDGAHAQLVRHHLQPRQRAHARDQHDVGDGLGQEIVGAGFQSAIAVGRAVERGDHHDGNVVRGRIGLEAAADFEAVHVGHHHVEQDDVAFGAAGQIASASVPFEAVITSKYSAERRASRSLTLAGTSSTTRIRADTVNSLPIR